MSNHKTISATHLCVAVIVALGFVWAATAGLRMLGVALLLPEVNQEETTEFSGASPEHSTPPALSPLLQIREREVEPLLAKTYLRNIADGYVDRRFVLILGASEAGHHGCNAEHCVTTDLADRLPVGWHALNLTRRGQTLCESADFLDYIVGDLEGNRFAVAMTINPIFFAAPGGIFPKRADDAVHAPAAGGALLADQEWARPEAETKLSFAAQLESRLAKHFGLAFLRRAIFRHRLGVSPVGDWQSNWLGPIARALLPEPSLENLRKIKVRSIDWSFFAYPGQGPTPQRSWRSYYASGNIDLDFAGRRMLDLDLNRHRACLVRMGARLQQLSSVGTPTLVIRTPLNPGMLALLNEKTAGANYTATYARFLKQWRAFQSEWRVPVQDLDELSAADFVDLDHLAPSGHARLARVIAENLLTARGN